MPLSPLASKAILDASKHRARLHPVAQAFIPDPMAPGIVIPQDPLARLLWRAARRKVPAPIVQSVETSPLEIRLKTILGKFPFLGYEDSFGLFFGPNTSPTQVGQSYISIKNTLRGGGSPVGVAAHEVAGHGGQWVANPSPARYRSAFPGLRYPAYPQTLDNELLPMYLERLFSHRPGRFDPSQIAEIVDPRAYNAALKSWFGK